MKETTHRVERYNIDFVVYILSVIKRCIKFVRRKTLCASNTFDG